MRPSKPSPNRIVSSCTPAGSLALVLALCVTSTGCATDPTSEGDDAAPIQVDPPAAPNAGTPAVMQPQSPAPAAPTASPGPTAGSGAQQPVDTTPPMAMPDAGTMDANTGSDAGAPADAGSDAAAALDEPRSAGCGMAANRPLGMWTATSVRVGGGDRDYDVRLPPGYDAMTAYPIILLLHGCGSPTNNVPMDQEAGDDAIVVRGSGTNDGCWHDTASGPDLPYIDALMDDVQRSLCVNRDHLFAVGYSSGSWLASTLSCHRGDVYRGIASVTGGEPGEINNCMGQHGRIYIHDAMDTTNRIEWDTPSRDRMLATNHCSMDTLPVEPSPCVEYQGCDAGYPVVWCETSGRGHDRQDSLARPAFWGFFQRLMQP
jgi:poly(3-hydroxybutyrate) depolymerase